VSTLPVDHVALDRLITAFGELVVHRLGHQVRSTAAFLKHGVELGPCFLGGIGLLCELLCLLLLSGVWLLLWLTRPLRR